MCSVVSRSVFLCIVAIPTFLAQPPISGKAGLVYYAEGDIHLNGRLVSHFIPMVRVSAGDVLRVHQGRAELLLQPENFLRLADDSEVEMKSDSLSSVGLMIQGAAILDIGVVGAKSSASVICGRAVTQIVKPGVYRFNCGRDELPNSLTVRRGRAKVTNDGQTIEVTVNQLLPIKEMKVSNLRDRQTDAFDDWSASRASLIAQKRGREPILEDKNKPPPANVILPGDRFPSPN